MPGSMQKPCPRRLLIVCITDRDQVIAVSGGARKELLQKAISQSLERVINERQTIQAGKDNKSFVRLVDEELEGITAQVVAPIICEGDAIGAVAIMSGSQEHGLEKWS